MKTFSSNFGYQKRQKQKAKHATVFVRITINGQRTEFSTNRTCDPSKWNPSTSRLSGKTEDVKSFNAYLQTIEHRIYEIHRELISKAFRLQDKQSKKLSTV